ncbi:Outer membrane protein W precursor [Candidatus Venteria ishoeyi]|uniref:Outer membrane protein W n=2 Tax=Candidatus Venteria ishoeyi TaxID=1899563 RepID=A0A1H6FG64_9GAMM|nr:Outer membrane protein W precursor [Candidatus Venteria ishoeyi]
MSMMKKTALSLSIAAAFAASIPAYAHEAGDILVRGRIINIAPSGTSENLKLDGTELKDSAVEAQSKATLDIDITYMISKNWGVELLLDIPTKHDVEVSGEKIPMADGSDAPKGIKIMETGVLPPALIAQYHFMPDAKFQPYVGAGINYTFFYSEKADNNLSSVLNNITKAEVENEFGLTAQIGADFMMDNGWFLNADVKYIALEPTAKITSDTGIVETKVKLNPWVFGIGVGKSF